MPKKEKFYSLNKILEKNADYNLIYGERSNGKTWAMNEYALKKFIDSGFVEETAYIRRWREDVKQAEMRTLFDGLTAKGVISKLTKGMYDCVVYKQKLFYLARFDEDLNDYIIFERPFMRVFALTDVEHTKSNAYPKITTIWFEEFISTKGYLPDEFIYFQQVISTIVRDRDNVKIFLTGNSVNRYSPYFSEMGLINVKNQKQDTIDVYTMGDGVLTIAVEYTEHKSDKKSDKYFCFDNPKLQMITSGKWQLDVYPKITHKIEDNDIVQQFFIDFDGELFHCKIVLEDDLYLYIHPKTKFLKKDDDIVYTSRASISPYLRSHWSIRSDKLDNIICSLFLKNKVFYSSNEVGNAIENFNREF